MNHSPFTHDTHSKKISKERVRYPQCRGLFKDTPSTGSGLKGPVLTADRVSFASCSMAALELYPR